MKQLETALEAQNKNDQLAYDKLTDYGKAVRDEKKSSAAAGRRMYGSSVIGVNRPKVRKAIK